MTEPSGSELWQRRLWWLSRIGSGVGLGTAGLLLGFAWGTRSYVESQLMPQLQQTLEATLGRRVTLGNLQFVLPWQITLADTQIEYLANIRQISVSANLGRWIREGELQLDVRLIRPHILLAETPDRGWANFSIPSGPAGAALPVSEITVQVEGGDVTAIPLKGERRTFHHVQASSRLDLATLTQPSSFNKQSGAAAHPPAQFQVQALLDRQPIVVQGEADPLAQTAQVQVRAKKLPLTLLPSLLPDVPLTALKGTADLNVKVALQPDQAPQLDGTLWVDAPEFGVTGMPQPLTQVNGPARLSGQKLLLDGIRAQYGTIPFQASGALQWLANGPTSAGFQIRAEVSSASLSQLETSFGIPKPPVPLSGRLSAQIELTGPLDQPRVLGRFQSLDPALVDAVRVERFSGQFLLRQSDLQFNQLSLQVAGGQVSGSGRIQLGKPEVGQFQLQTSQIDVQQIAVAYKATPPYTLGRLNGPVHVDLAGNQPRVTAQWQLIGGQIQGRGTYRFAQGISTIPQSQLELIQNGSRGTLAMAGELTPNQLTARLTQTQLPLALFSPQLRGMATGEFTLRASPSQLNASGIRAQGELQLPQGAGPLRQPMRANIAWTGSRLEVKQGDIAGLAQIQGYIPVDPNTLAIGPLALTVSAQQVDLSQFQAEQWPTLPQLPPELPLGGSLNLQAQLSGPLQDLKLQGQVQLQGGRIDGLRFASLQGPLFWQAKSGELSLNLQGGEDQLAFWLGSDFLPQRFRLRQGQVEAKGERIQEDLDIQVSQFPLRLVSELLPPNIPSLQGDLNGRLKVNLSTGSTLGQATVDAVKMAGIEAKQVVADFRYQDQQLQISQASLQLLSSRYQAAGTIDLRHSKQDSPRLNVRVATTDGNLQDIIAALKWRTWDDVWQRGIRLPPLGPASAVEADPISVLALSLLEQLKVYEQIRLKHQQAQTQKASDSPLPELQTVRGEFQSTVSIGGTLAQPSVGFNVTGQNWQATNWQVDRVTAQGMISPTEIKLAPLTLTTGDREASYEGTLGQTRQQGSLRLQKVPLALLQPFLPSAVQLQGDATLTAEISGSLDHPLANGSLQLAEARVNQVPFTSASGRFLYQKGQLNLESALQTTTNSPIRIMGRIPFRLPFSQDQPSSSDLDLNLQMENEGLELVNLVTDEVKVSNSLGKLDLQITGSLREPELAGTLSVQNGLLNLKALPEPITQVKGTVRFNFNDLTVEQLSGQFGQGQIEAAGSLPINLRGVSEQRNQGGETTSLAVTLKNLNLNIPLFQGKAEGTVTIGGQLLQPQIGGQILLSAGRVNVNQGGSEPAPAPVKDPVETASSWFKPLFNNLELQLAADTDIRHPLFRFIGKGGIKLLGSPQQPHPNGTIQLDRGQVNLFASTFRLDRSRPNQVTFDGKNGLDPFLKMRLTTQATEFFRNSSEIALFEPNRNLPGSQQTIQIFADVEGFASQLDNVSPTSSIVRLSSSPSRSPDEIVALLGGNAVANFSTGNTLVGVAGSTLLFSLQDTLVELLGVDEVKLGPIPQVSTQAQKQFTLGLGLEIAKDLGPSLSISAQRNLSDAVQPTRYSLRYNLSDELLTRFSTDFQGNNSASIEFETRF